MSDEHSVSTVEVRIVGAKEGAADLTDLASATKGAADGLDKMGDAERSAAVAQAKMNADTVEAVGNLGKLERKYLDLGATAKAAQTDLRSINAAIIAGKAGYGGEDQTRALALLQGVQQSRGFTLTPDQLVSMKYGGLADLVRSQPQPPHAEAGIAADMEAAMIQEGWDKKAQKIAQTQAMEAALITQQWQEKEQLAASRAAIAADMEAAMIQEGWDKKAQKIAQTQAMEAALITQGFAKREQVMAQKIAAAQSMEIQAWQDELNAPAKTHQQTMAAVNEHNPAYALTQRLAAQSELLKAGIAKGGPDVGAMTVALTSLERQQVRVAAGTDHATGALLNNKAMFLGMIHPFRAGLDQLMMGANPMQVLAVQATELTSVLGIGGVAFFGYALAAAAVVAPFVIIGAHALTLTSELRALNAETIAFNNHAFGGDQWQAMAHAMAASGTFNRSDTEAAVAEMMKYRLAPASTQTAIGSAVVPFAEATRKKPAEAAKELEDAMKGGYDGIMKLNSAYGFLQPAEAQHILDLSLQGKFAEAARVALEALSKQTEAAAQKARGPVAQGWMELGNAITKSLDNVVKGSAFIALERFIGDMEKFAAGNARIGLASIGSLLGVGGVALVAALTAPPSSPKVDSPIKRWGLDPYREMKPPSDAASDAAAIAAQKERAIYFGRDGMQGRVGVAGMFGPAQQLAQINQDAAEKLLTAGNAADRAKIEADRLGDIAKLSAAQHASTAQRLCDLELEANANIALTAATGDYAKTVQAQIDAEVAQRKVKQDPGMSAESEAALRAQLAGAKESERVKAQANFIKDLRDKVAAANEAADRMLDIGAKRGSRTAPDAQAEDAARQRGFTDPAVKKEMEDLRNAEERKSTATAAQQYIPEFAYNESVARINKVRDSLDSLHLTTDQLRVANDNLTQDLVAANIKLLESSRNWADGAQAALLKYANDAQNYGHMADQAVTNSMNSATNSLVEFSMGTKTAGAAFTDFVTSVVKDIQRMVIQAQITGPLARMINSAIDGWRSGPSMADAGFSTQGVGSNLALADGGLITGPGGPRSDSILAAMSNGEFVVNAAATSKNLALLQAINSNTPHYANGGMVGSMPALPRPANGGAGDGGTTVQIYDQRSASNSAPVQTQDGGRGPDGKRILRVMIGEENKRAMRTGQNDVDMRANYGVARQGVSRG